VTDPRIVVDTEEREGGLVARLTVDNEAKLNIVGSRLLEEFLAAVEPLGREPRLRAVILTGAGEKAFIGGADINEMAGLDPATARQFITRLHRCCEALRELPVPVIARIRGYALGAGLEVAASCDIRIAAEDARFGMPEVKVGIPSVIEAALLPSLIGWGRTRRLLYLGDIIGAAEAEAWGLVERVVPVASLDAAVDEWIAELLRCGARAIRLQKKLIRAWEELTPTQAIAAGIDCFAEAWTTDEPRAAMRAFLDRRRRS
jgi:enoyl-CoA hydratase/carnithine racemase